MYVQDHTLAAEEAAPPCTSSIAVGKTITPLAGAPATLCPRGTTRAGAGSGGRNHCGTPSQERTTDAGTYICPFPNAIPEGPARPGSSCDNTRRHGCRGSGASSDTTDMVVGGHHDLERGPARMEIGPISFGSDAAQLAARRCLWQSGLQNPGAVGEPLCRRSVLVSVPCPRLSCLFRLPSRWLTVTPGSERGCLSETRQ